MSNKFQKIYRGFRRRLALSKFNLWFYLATLSNLLWLTTACAGPAIQPEEVGKETRFVIEMPV